MCSRFELSSSPRDLARRFSLDDLPSAFTTGEIRPTNGALIVNFSGAATKNWGLSVDWDKKPIINARAETLDRKPTFQPLLENRCLVPATAYFEWRRDGTARFKNRIAAGDGALFCFAGLTDGERFTVITRAPLPSVAHIHNRMPVILPAAIQAEWIEPAAGFGDVAHLLGNDMDVSLIAGEDTPPPPRQGDLFG